MMVEMATEEVPLTLLLSKHITKLKKKMDQRIQSILVTFSQINQKISKRRMSSKSIKKSNEGPNYYMV